MKKYILAALIVTATSCGTGTVVTFGKDGITVTPPSEPIVIPNSGK